MAEPFRYWAFISYSSHDGAIGRRLIRALETYRIPRPLVGRRTPTCTVPRRLTPVFRDRDELRAGALDEQLREALRQSLAVVVVCSPHAARSSWVNKEVTTFKTMGGEARVLPFVVDGEPWAGDPDRECFPPAVGYRVDAAGTVTAERVERLGGDARAKADGWRNAKLKIVAGILDVDFDALRQRDRERRIRRTAFVGAAAILAALVVTGLVLYGNQQRRVALSRRLAAQAMARTDTEPVPSLLLAAESQRAEDTYEGRNALLTLLTARPGLTAILPSAPALHGALALGRDGHTLVMPGCAHLGDACDALHLAVWDLASRAAPRTIAFDAVPLSAAVSPDGATIAVGGCANGEADLGCEGGAIELRAAAADAPRRGRLTGHGGPVVDLAFLSADRLVSRGGSTVILWDVSRATRLAEWPVYGTGGPGDAALGVAGDTVAAWGGGDAGPILRWMHGRLEKPAERLGTGAALREVSAVAVTRDGRRVAVAGCASDSNEGFCNRAEVRLWDADEGRFGEPMDAPSDWIRALAFDRDGDLLVGGSCGRRRNGICVEGELRLWTPSEPWVLQRITAHHDEIVRVAFSEDGETMVSLGDDATAMVWRVGGGEPAADARLSQGLASAAVMREQRAAGHRPGEEEAGEGAACTPDGALRAIAVASGTRVWDVAAQAWRGPVVPSTAVGAVKAALRDDGRVLATGGCRKAGDDVEPHCVEGAIALWQVGTDQPARAQIGGLGYGVTALAFSHDGGTLAAVGCTRLDPWDCKDGTAQLFDAGSGAASGTPIDLVGLRPSSVAFSPDERQLVVGGCWQTAMLEETRLCQSAEIRVLELPGGRPMATFLARESGWITALAMNADATILASGDDEGIVGLWDVGQSQPLGRGLRGHPGAVLGLAWLDRDTVVSYGPSADAVWDASPGRWREDACKVANRNLTCEEWRRYIGDLPYHATCPAFIAPACE